MKTGRPDLDAKIRISAIPADEPTFLLRGRDPAAAPAVRAWVGEAGRSGAPVAVLEQALQQADRMAAWPDRKAADDDHLSRHERLQLEYQLTRRARTWWEEADGVATKDQVLAYAAGVNEGAAAGRGARALIDAALEGFNNAAEENENTKALAIFARAMALLQRARAVLVREDDVG